MSGLPQRLLPWIGGVALLAQGCGKGGETEREDLLECDWSVTVLEVDEESTLGFAASDILAFAEGTHRGPLVWLEQDPPVVVGPETGEGEFELTVVHDDGEVRGPDPDASARSCAELEIDVSVSLRSSGGALDEQVPATLTASLADEAFLLVSLEAADLKGSLSVEGLDPDLPWELVLDAILAADGVSGYLEFGATESEECDDGTCDVVGSIVSLARLGPEPQD